jgi:hypothetical protein
LRLAIRLKTVSFDRRREKHTFPGWNNIQVNLDNTTPNDHFLILSASINVAGEHDLMLYCYHKKLPEAEKSNRPNEDGWNICQGLGRCCIGNGHRDPTSGLQIPVY